MWDKIKEFFIYSSEVGLKLPSAYDADKKGPSVTLLFVHVANFVAILSICLLFKESPTIGVISATGYSLAMMGFYLIKRLGKFSVDLKDGKIEAEDDIPDSPIPIKEEK